MKHYSGLLHEVDAWFHSVRKKQISQMQCGRGCTLCCHGLFDISLPDAVVLAEGFTGLPAKIRAEVAERADAIQQRILRAAPDLKPPYLLTESSGRIDAIADGVGNPPCPFLSGDGACVVYRSRPLACRLEGVPMVDRRDGLFGDWCELNFKDGVSPEARRDLKRDYCLMQEIEMRAEKDLIESLPERPPETVTIFIPSLIAGFRPGAPMSEFFFGRAPGVRKSRKTSVVRNLIGERA